jgi:hypothetical protein
VDSHLDELILAYFFLFFLLTILQALWDAALLGVQYASHRWYVQKRGIGTLKDMYRTETRFCRIEAFCWQFNFGFLRPGFASERREGFDEIKRRAYASPPEILVLLLYGFAPINPKNIAIWVYLAYQFYGPGLNSLSSGIDVQSIWSAIVGLDWTRVEAAATLMLGVVIALVALRGRIRVQAKNRHRVNRAVAALELLSKLDRHLGRSLNGSTANIDRLYQLLDSLPGSYCAWATSGAYHIEDSDQIIPNPTPVIEDAEVAHPFVDLDPLPSLDPLVEVAKELEEKGLWWDLRELDGRSMKAIPDDILWSSIDRTRLEKHLLNRDTLVELFSRNRCQIVLEDIAESQDTGESDRQLRLEDHLLDICLDLRRISRSFIANAILFHVQAERYLTAAGRRTHPGMVHRAATLFTGE